MAKARRLWVKRCEQRLSAREHHHTLKRLEARANAVHADRQEYRARARRSTAADLARACPEDACPAGPGDPGNGGDPGNAVDLDARA